MNIVETQYWKFSEDGKLTLIDIFLGNFPSAVVSSFVVDINSNVCPPPVTYFFIDDNEIQNSKDHQVV